jgi:hypothetical protein
MSDQVPKVGYKHPPREHQFAPGVSGNPRGRPKGASFAAELTAELNEIVSFNEDGVVTAISKQRALIKKLFAAALKGDFRATTALLSFLARVAPADPAEQDAPEDRAIMEEFSGRSKSRSPRKPRSPTCTTTSKD